MSGIITCQVRVGLAHRDFRTNFRFFRSTVLHLIKVDKLNFALTLYALILMVMMTAIISL